MFTEQELRHAVLRHVPAIPEPELQWVVTRMLRGQANPPDNPAPTLDKWAQGTVRDLIADRREKDLKAARRAAPSRTKGRYAEEALIQEQRLAWGAEPYL